MKLTKRGEYALRTLIRLGIADQQGEGVISVSTLADQEQQAVVTKKKSAKARHTDPADSFLAAFLEPVT